jgi:drug/metabolite transporter (DMT)-like permease
MAGICLIVGVQALAGLGAQLTAEIATVTATICYAGGAIFSRGFKGLDPMAPAAGSLLCSAAILVPASLVIDRRGRLRRQQARCWRSSVLRYSPPRWPS